MILRAVTDSHSQEILSRGQDKRVIVKFSQLEAFRNPIERQYLETVFPALN